MSLKLICALPATVNCLKSTRLLLPSSSVKRAHIVLQTRWLSAAPPQAAAEPKKPLFKPVYYGNLSPHVRSVKLFSISSSIIGLLSQPFLYREILSTGNVPAIVAAYSFIGFFTVVTPLLLHTITKKYVTELSYNEDTDTYLLKTFNLFCRVVEMEFKVDDVYVPDVPGMFVTFHVKGKPVFVDPRFFDHPQHYAKLMGYDKPIDFKLYDKETTEKS